MRSCHPGRTEESRLVSPRNPGKPRRAFGALRPLEILALLCETVDIFRGLPFFFTLSVAFGSSQVAFSLLASIVFLVAYPLRYPQESKGRRGGIEANCQEPST